MFYICVFSHRKTRIVHICTKYCAPRNEVETQKKDFEDSVRETHVAYKQVRSAIEVIQIASLLGYSNASAFTRAFRRWSSTTPASWLVTAKGGG